MKRIVSDRGVQAGAAAGVVLALLTVVFVDRYATAWLALWATWAVVVAAAAVHAARRAG